MKERLRAYLDKLFTDVPRSSQASELREEIYANLCDKYDNMIAKGMNEEEAYYSTISSIGNIDELLGELGPSDAGFAVTKKERQRSILLRSLAGASPFLGIAGFVVGLWMGNAGIAFLLLFLFIGAGVAMRSFAKLSEVPSVTKEKGARRTYIKGEEGETVVEEFKEFRRGKSRMEQLKSTVLTCMWLLIVILFFVLSFITGAWYITWIIFLVGVALSQAIKCYFNLKELDETNVEK